MQPSNSSHRAGTSWLCLPWLTLLAATTLRTAAADFRIEEVRLGAGGRLELHFPADPASYYRLLRGDAVTAITPPPPSAWPGR